MDIKKRNKVTNLLLKLGKILMIIGLLAIVIFVISIVAFIAYLIVQSVVFGNVYLFGGDDYGITPIITLVILIPMIAGMSLASLIFVGWGFFIKGLELSYLRDIEANTESLANGGIATVANQSNLTKEQGSSVEKGSMLQFKTIETKESPVEAKKVEAASGTKAGNTSVNETAPVNSNAKKEPSVATTAAAKPSTVKIDPPAPGDSKEDILSKYTKLYFERAISKEEYEQKVRELEQNG